MTVVSILLAYYPTLFGGLLVTLELFLSASVVSLGCGIVFGSLATRYSGVGTAIRITSFLVGGIPFLILLYWFYYPFQAIIGIQMSPFLTALIALTVVNTG